MPWHGPYRIRELLETAIDDNRDWPGQGVGVYVVTRDAWTKEPTRQAFVLYVGGNTGSSNRFRTRIGDLIADMFGFFGDKTGHHSGGQSLWQWCHAEGVSPLDLHIGWDNDVNCKRCAEVQLYRALAPKLNKIRPSRCREHG